MKLEINPGDPLKLSPGPQKNSYRANRAVMNRYPIDPRTRRMKAITIKDRDANIPPIAIAELAAATALP